jgi:hypothetical protein
MIPSHIISVYLFISICVMDKADLRLLNPTINIQDNRYKIPHTK